VDCRLVCLVGHLVEGLGPGQPAHEGPPGTAVHGQCPVHDKERKERRVSGPRAFRLPAPHDTRPRSRRRCSSLAEGIAVYYGRRPPACLKFARIFRLFVPSIFRMEGIPMHVRQPGYYTLILPKGSAITIGYWNGHAWKLAGSSVEFPDDYFADIADGPEHPRPNLTPEQQAQIRGI